MGNKALKKKKVSWIKPHKLEKNEEFAESEILKLSNFGDTLYLCYEEKKQYKVKYQHWFVTDRIWTIEFNQINGKYTVFVHNYPMNKECVEQEKFLNSPVVRERMEKVCGATNYSLALRNCEHVARYIFSGIWASFQMHDRECLGKIFLKHMSAYTHLSNSLPEDLIPQKEEMVTLDRSVNDFIRFPIEKKALTSDDHKKTSPKRRTLEWTFKKCFFSLKTNHQSFLLDAR